ncbi:hypothetical protein LJC43_04575 [Parabacteroides sp. OttesenSCG-928-G21]|nr:hypothetical protein [Parabacteroides sp. OttesenSCG-928-G21]
MTKDEAYAVLIKVENTINNVTRRVSTPSDCENIANWVVGLVAYAQVTNDSELSKRIRMLNISGVISAFTKSWSTTRWLAVSPMSKQHIYNARDAIARLHPNNSGVIDLLAMRDEENTIPLNKEMIFEDFLICDKEQKTKLMDALKFEFKGAKGKKASTVLSALHQLEMIVIRDKEKQKVYNALNSAFGLNLKNQSCQPYIKNYADGVRFEGLNDDEVSNAISRIKALGLDSDS